VSNGPDDKALNEYLSGNSPYSARYRELEADDVPPELDAAILSHSKEAIATQSTHRRLGRWRRWSVPATLAATFVLVVSLVIQNNLPLTSLDAPQLIQEEKAEESTVTVDLTLPSQSLQREFAPEIALTPPPPKLDMPPPPAPLTDSTGTAATSSAIETTTAAKPAAPASYAEARAANQAEDRSTAAPAIQSPAPAATAPQAAREEAAKLARSESAERGARNQPHISAAQVAEAERASDAREADPKLWLEHIRQLRKENKVEDANVEWRKFRERYPDFIVEANDTARGPEPK
jgi:hypothetical protein